MKVRFFVLVFFLLSLFLTGCMFFKKSVKSSQNTNGVIVGVVTIEQLKQLAVLLEKLEKTEKLQITTVDYNRFLHPDRKHIGVPTEKQVLK